MGEYYENTPPVIDLLIRKRSARLLTGSVDGEKSANNNGNNKLISIYFNNKLAI
jgi:hypothetical protein